MSRGENKAFVRRYIEELNKGEAALMAFVDEFYVTNFVGHSATGEEMHGIEGYKQFMRALFNALPDLHYTIDDMVAEGDKVVLRVTLTGTHKGEFRGIPPTNKKMAMWEIIIVRLAGGKVLEEWARSDTLGLMQQLGVIPTPKR